MPLLWLALLALPAVALGEEPEPIPSVEDAAAEDTAWRAFEAHRAKDYARAASLFVRAYELSGNPTQLWNAAKTLELADDLPAALAAWRRFLAQPGVEGERRATAEAQIGALAARIEAARARAALEQGAATVAAAPTERTWSPLPFVMIGGGAAALGGGVALYASGYATYADWARTMDTLQIVSREEAEAAELRAGAGVALGAAGVASILLGVALWWLDDAAPPLALVPGPSALTIVGALPR